MDDRSGRLQIPVAFQAILYCLPVFWNVLVGGVSCLFLQSTFQFLHFMAEVFVRRDAAADLVAGVEHG